MDWNLFWNAFGAIGTTAGSLITAIAVVVAVKQYRQPITKKIKVTHSFTLPLKFETSINPHISITVKNHGIRDVTINAFYLSFNKQLLFINLMQSKDMPILGFPCTLKSEQSLSLNIRHDDLLREFKKLRDEKVIKVNQKFKIYAQDSLGDKHYDKIKMRFVNGVIKMR